MIGKYPAWLVLLFLGTTPVMACDLKVSSAWIREAPPGLMTLAGYASLINDGDKPLRIVKAQSSVFTEIQMHESSIVNGVASMHAINALELAAYQHITFAPNGKHFMLMGARKSFHKGDVVIVQLQDQRDCVTEAEFTVRGSDE
jgi:copper(I)-binding protein